MKGTIEVLCRAMDFNRQRTLTLLERVEKTTDPEATLAWRPGSGRAHVAWQLMHIGVTELIFASERLAPNKPHVMEEFWARFRGGSVVDDDVPSIPTIRQVLDTGRTELRSTLSSFSDDDLNHIPAALQERQLSLLDVLHILCFHESHHHGQAHLTLNLFESQFS